ncbi:MAG: signal transduction histidine kinase [Candidatus Paceibacteria bacterium]|jgi:signal transduction histidine kinase
MRISLGLRVLTLVGTINFAVFGAGLYFLSEELGRTRQTQHEQFAGRALLKLSNSINSEGELGVAQILEWPFWDVVTDAIIVDRNPSGVSLNPVGAFERGAGFDRSRIEQDLAQAMESKLVVPRVGGMAMPIMDRGGEVWGGCWFRVQPGADERPIWLGLLPWFLASTLLLFFGTFGVLRRYVLRPVGALAEGVAKIRGGNFELEIAAPRHSDELTSLIATFNQMASDVHNFHAYLEHEADAAKEKAFQAEAAALRQRRLAAMGELAAGIAHEINNPLGGMLNAVEVLEREGTSAEKRARYHQLLQGGLERIQGTVTKLLRFTPRQAQLGPLDFSGPIRDAVDLVRHRAESQNVRFSLDFEPVSPSVQGLHSELGQAVLNLLVNALDALQSVGEGGEIEVLLRPDGEGLILSVLDNGPGIDEDQLERVADLFYTTKDVGRGTGLGLALVHNVVAEHGGVVQIRNREGGGLRVDLVFPSATGMA